ncbi:MAG TPA: NAD(P)H:quinone oxidoreductase [Spirochaetales bacterium]|nr:NAD(P)H:quinone oxidoreductase [Spirochaetales bacterium]HRY55388.1 NAD(P)H:quinone oxidoreductase [Spirochaetia bacterium]
MKPKIAVYFYSTYGHMYEMAKAAAAGIEEAGADAALLRVPETLPAEVLKAMHADEAQKAFASVQAARFEEFGDYDGYVFAFPTRFGVVPAQFKAFLDATGQAWSKGALESKPVAMMTSSAMQHGGQEATILGLIPYVLHHGGLYVGLPLSSGVLGGVDELSGNSFYGASTIAGGDGSRRPSANELAGARFQGKRVAQLAERLKGSKV